jgi:hypothetical protein
MGELLILVTSAVLIILGAYLSQKGAQLSIRGKQTEAIIFKNNFESSSGVYFPVVRFLTDKNEWISTELNVGYSPALTEGTKLEVIYDPEDPTIVEVDSKAQLRILPVILAAFGVAGFTLGVLEYLDVTQLLRR